jgi:serine/threonine-protein kinase
MTVAAPSDVLPKLDKFELCEEIGHGGMATVYRAKDLRLGREVAVKIIHRHLRDNPEVATRFVSEARAAAKLKHRGIVEVYDVSSEDDREKFLVVELIRGRTLRKILLEDRDMPAEIGAAIVAELCDAVEHAHAAGIVHRDIKPENVLVERPSDRTRPVDDADLEAKSGATPVGLSRASLDGDGADTGDGAVSATPSSGPEGRGSKRAGAKRKKGDRERASEPVPSKPPKSGRGQSDVVIKLTDFGIAKVLDAQGVTSTGQVLGSPAHMAPEQIEGGDIDPRTDVFALGVLLYECQVGHLPFEGKNPAQVLRRVIEGDFSPAEIERPSVGGRFSQIVAAALANKPEDRLESPQALADELRKELAELGLSDPRAEIAAYFEDPEAYRAALATRIVPKLVARGEGHRKARRIQLAACDFNRAHALSPDDASILRRITQLSSTAGRERMMKRGAVLVAGALALGGVTYGVARAVRLQNVRLGPTSTTGLPSQAEPPPPLAVHANDEPSSRPAPAPSTATARIKAVVVPLARSIEAPSGAPPNGGAGANGPRAVTIGISPMGARLELDGQPVDPLGKVFMLSPGSHPYVLRPAPGSDCCDVKSGSLVVVAGSKDKPDEKQMLAVALDPKPATVRVTGGPAGASVACGPYTFIVGSQQEVRLSSVDQSVTCLFPSDSGTIKKPVSLKAGTTNTIPWPSGG